MKMETLLVLGIFILAVPLLGVMLAMALGIVVAFSRRAGGIAVLDRLEPPLRCAVTTFGYSVQGVRNVPDRRGGERRARARQRHLKDYADRRRSERRLLERRARDRGHSRGAASVR